MIKIRRLQDSYYLVNQQIQIGNGKIIYSIQRYTRKGLHNLIIQNKSATIFYEHSPELELLVNQALEVNDGIEAKGTKQ